MIDVKLMDILYCSLHTQRLGCFMKKMVVCYSLMNLALKDEEGVYIFS